MPRIRDSLRGHLGVVSAFALLTIFFARKLLINPDKILYSPVSDIIWLYSYYGYFFSRSINLLSQFPFWNPHICAGTPFFGMMYLSSLSYPLGWLVFILSPDFAMGMITVLHVFLAGVFTYFFMKSLGKAFWPSFLSGIIYMFSGTMMYHISLGTYTQLHSIIWLPLLFLLVERLFQTRRLSYALGGGLILALQILAGYPFYVLLSGIALAFYSIFRLYMEKQKGEGRKELLKIFSFLVLIPILAAGLTAFQILPTAEYMQYATRSGGISFDTAAGTSLNPLTLATTISPVIFGTVMNETCFLGQNTCNPSLYVGILPLLLALFAIYYKRDKQTIFFSLLAVFAILYALGKYTVLPFYLFYRFVPFFNVFRIPLAILFVYAFAMAVLSGFGFSYFISKDYKKAMPRLERLLLIAVVLLAIVSIVAFTQKAQILEYGMGFMEARYSYYTSLPAYVPAYELSHYRNMVAEVFSTLSYGLHTLLLLVAGIYGLLYIRKKELISLQNLKILLTLLVLLDLLIMAMPYIDVKDPEDYFGSTPEVEFLTSHEEPSTYRVLLLYGQNWTVSLAEYRTLRQGIDVAGCTDPTRPKRFNDVLTASLDKPYWSDSTYHHEVRSQKLLSLMNVKYLAVRPDIDIYSDLEGYSLAHQDGDMLLYENREVLPRAYIVQTVRVMQKSGILEHIDSEDFNPREAAVTEEPLGRLEYNGEFEAAEIKLFTPNKVVLSLSGENEGLLVLSETYFPGWSASVDGKPREIHLANYAFRGVVVEKGEREVVFEYLPTDFMGGMAIALLTLTAIIALFLFDFLKSRNVDSVVK